MYNMSRGNYALTMIAGAVASVILAQGSLAILILAVVAAQIYATVLRARDAGVNPVLWSFLIFLPFGWIVLAFKPAVRPTFFPSLAIAAE